MSDRSPLFAKSYGDKSRPAVILLHGFLGDHLDWTDVVEALADDYYCVAVDLPGHGNSHLSLQTDNYSFVVALSDLVDVADNFGLDHFSVVGYSMGGRLALYMAAQCAMRIDKLVLESASPGLRTEDDRRARRENDELIAQRMETEDPRYFLERWFEQPIFASLQLRKPRLYEELLTKRIANVPSELAAALRSLGTGSQPSLWGDLASVTMPVLAVVGELDAKFVAVAEEMKLMCPPMMVHRVPECDHQVHLETPEAYTLLLRKFLATGRV